MTEPATGSVVIASAALSLSGMWGATILGLQFGTIGQVTGFVVLGAFGRLGFEIAKQAESVSGVRWSKIAALFGGSLISAATIAVLWLAILKASGIQNDGATLFGAIICGIVGPKVLLWLYSAGSATFTKQTGIKLPGVETPTGEQKP